MYIYILYIYSHIAMHNYEAVISLGNFPIGISLTKSHTPHLAYLGNGHGNHGTLLEHGPLRILWGEQLLGSLRACAELQQPGLIPPPSAAFYGECCIVFLMTDSMDICQFLMYWIFGFWNVVENGRSSQLAEKLWAENYWWFFSRWRSQGVVHSQSECQELPYFQTKQYLLSQWWKGPVDKGILVL